MVAEFGGFLDGELVTDQTQVRGRLGERVGAAANLAAGVVQGGDDTAGGADVVGDQAAGARTVMRQR